MTKDTTFKQCPKCNQSWSSRESFLKDESTEFLGYQAFVEDGVLGMFLFNHASCETTLALSAADFVDLKPVELYQAPENQHGEPSPHCLSSLPGRPCPEKCECNFVREVIHVIKTS